MSTIPKRVVLAHAEQPLCPSEFATSMRRLMSDLEADREKPVRAIPYDLSFVAVAADLIAIVLDHKVDFIDDLAKRCCELHLPTRFFFKDERSVSTRLIDALELRGMKMPVRYFSTEDIVREIRFSLFKPVQVSPTAGITVTQHRW